MFKIKRLTCWAGDHFNESWEYKLIGYTDNVELAEMLSRLTINQKVADKSPWPMCHMSGWVIFQVEPIINITDEQILKSVENIYQR